MFSQLSYYAAHKFLTEGVEALNSIEWVDATAHPVDIIVDKHDADIGSAADTGFLIWASRTNKKFKPSKVTFVRMDQRFLKA